MTPAFDIAQVGAGLEAPALDSQRVFRAALAAIARPGTLHTIDARAQWPAELHPAAGALLLALLDQDTSVWLSAPARPATCDFLRFHTGCVIAESPAQADFACVLDATQLPPWTSFEIGTDEYPHRSTTVLIQLASLRHGSQWTCSGPGIDAANPTRIALEGMPTDFGDAWNTQRRTFPRGVDVYFIAGGQLLGLPRTTSLQLIASH